MLRLLLKNGNLVKCRHKKGTLKDVTATLSTHANFVLNCEFLIANKKRGPLQRSGFLALNFWLGHKVYFLYFIEQHVVFFPFLESVIPRSCFFRATVSVSTINMTGGCPVEMKSCYYM